MCKIAVFNFKGEYLTDTELERVPVAGDYYKEESYIYEVLAVMLSPNDIPRIKVQRLVSPSYELIPKAWRE